MPQLSRTVNVPVEVQELFGWHERHGALERLSPPWQPIEVVGAPGGLAAGTRVVLRLRLAGPLALRWVAEHVEYEPPRRFRDVQVSGPFAIWDHRHTFAATDGHGSTLTDEVTYELPFGRLGSAAKTAVHTQLARVFAYRHRQMSADLAAHAAAADRGTTPMHVAITGASGLIGRQLAAFLTTGGHTVTRLVRGEAGAGEVTWDPQAGTIDREGLRGLDAVVHLAGEPIGKRFTAEHKRRVRESRARGTRALATALAEMPDGPRILVSSSAIGYYGSDRGAEVLTESSAPGHGFLAEVCRAWEGATDPAKQAGLRVVHVRTGIAQSPAGGQLARQLPLFRIGLGGRLGSGKQHVSWIALDDVVGLYHHALTADIEGALNATAPHPVTNAEYTDVLGRVLHRPTAVPVPALGPAVLLGREGAKETALASQRVLPAQAEASGYTFRYPDLEGCLRHILGRT